MRHRHRAQAWQDQHVEDAPPSAARPPTPDERCSGGSGGSRMPLALLIPHCPSLIVHCSLLIPYCPLSIAHRSLLNPYCPFFIAHADVSFRIAHADCHVQVTDQTMAMVARSFTALSARYPRDFLNFIGALDLHPEPEVLGGQVPPLSQIGQPTPPFLQGPPPSQIGQPTPPTPFPDKAAHPPQETHNVMLPRLLILGSHQRCPKGIWREALARHSRIAND